MSTARSTIKPAARLAARHDYIRWLGERFRDLDMMQTKEGEEKVQLRNIYVPLHLDTKDRRDEDMGTADGLDDEQAPGQDARELIAAQPLIAIAGRPGSGKTTLVHALIGELCSERPSDFRRALVAEVGVLPIPLILRDYQAVLGGNLSLDGLLDAWWANARNEACDKGIDLDPEALKAGYGDAAEVRPLLLFDGIDEVGGVVPRQAILHMA